MKKFGFAEIGLNHIRSRRHIRNAFGDLISIQAEIRLKELEKKRLSEEIAEKEDQLDAINAAFWSNHVFMQQALSNRNKFLQKMSEWSERNDRSVVKSDR